MLEYNQVVRAMSNDITQAMRALTETETTVLQHNQRFLTTVVNRLSAKVENRENEVVFSYRR